MRPTVQDVPVILLAIVMVLLSGMAFVTITHEAHHHFSAASGAPIYALAICQAFLLGLWVGIGRTRSVVRLPVVLLIFGALIQFTCYLAPEYPVYSDFRETIAFNLGATAALVAFVTGAARTLGLVRLIRLGDPLESARIAAPAGWKFHFTLAEALGTTAGFGIALAICKCLVPSIDAMPVNEQRVRFTSIEMFVLLALTAAWAVLTIEFRIWRLGAALTATVAVLYLLAMGNNLSSAYAVESLGIWRCLALVTASLFACRASGYRIAGRRRAIPSALLFPKPIDPA